MIWNGESVIKNDDGRMTRAYAMGLKLRVLFNLLQVPCLMTTNLIWLVMRVMRK